jgi:hypothetical protein
LDFSTFKVVDCLWLEIDGLTSRGRDDRAQDYFASLEYQGEGGKWLMVTDTPVCDLPHQLYEDFDLSSLVTCKSKPFTVNISTRAMRLTLKLKNIDREAKPPEEVC